MGALSFWYVWATGIRKKLINLTLKKRKIFRGGWNWPIFSLIFWGLPLPFFKDEIYQLFSYSYVSKVPKWKCTHILLCKKYKNCLKLLKIADLQPPDWIQRKKTPGIYGHFFGFASTIHPPTTTLLDIMTETLFATQFHQKLVSTILKTLYGGRQCLELCVVFVSANCRW